MILFASLLKAFAQVFHLLLMGYMWIIIIRAVLSWVYPNPYHPLVRTLYYLTEPVLQPCRRIVPPYKLGGIDISPIIVIFLILFIDSFLVTSLSHYALSILEGK
ncbi:MAG: YggT family protein [Candidatus Aminicenantia bacterium]